MQKFMKSDGSHCEGVRPLKRTERAEYDFAFVLRKTIGRAPPAQTPGSGAVSGP